MTRLYQDLREAIVSLKIAPGATLSEGSVSRNLGGSRTPVRSALERLEREGLVTTAGHGTKRRLIVSPLTATDMRQLFLMVGALNGVAARLAAQLAKAPRQQLVKELQRINENLGRLAHEDVIDVKRAEELDSQFHRSYEVVGDAPQLVLELESLGARRTRYVRVYTEALVHARNLRESVAEHSAIIDALAAGDPESAEQCAAFNHRQALERFSRALQASGERGTWF
ncbi:MAG TPA: GntR family transcriptional regulator [Vicinamibacterales bacterium]|nr:GntR family transcriptional regulator [Vicinamibacterales bacterium]